MFSKQATIRNEYGIHCRPSAIIAKEAQNYPGTVRVTTAHVSDISIDSILALVGLGIKCGDTITVSVTGQDEEDTCNRMVELFETNFDFPR